MIDKDAIRFDASMDSVSTKTNVKRRAQPKSHDNRLKLERLNNRVLAISIHRDQLQELLDVFESKGIEPFRCEDSDTSAGEYELLYFTSENAQVDINRYQRILDNAA